jgi:adenosylhomocysteine nucleosidase
VNTLVCFAVRDEARFFQPAAGCRVLVTGMGPRAARTGLETALAKARPALVLTCGFAGGLNPDLPSGALVFETADPSLSSALRAQGARPASFHCAARVAITRTEKQSLRATTCADAVEMESGVIRDLCRERAIPCVTLRVISDAASEDLPVDFNPLITPDGALRLGGLIAHVLKQPACIPGMLRLQKRTRQAARALATCLEGFLRRI